MILHKSIIVSALILQHALYIFACVDKFSAVWIDEFIVLLHVIHLFLYFVERLIGFCALYSFSYKRKHSFFESIVAWCECPFLIQENFEMSGFLTDPSYVHVFRDVRIEVNIFEGTKLACIIENIFRCDMIESFMLIVMLFVVLLWLFVVLLTT